MVMFCAEKYLLGSESKLRLMVGERESERREGDSDKVREKSSGDTAQKTLGDIFNHFVKIVKELPG